ncbi:MAG: precorrin-2 C(20)-methyltransferase [Clostridia bacterium]|nr:precorrin-2 C(20)-methyltransferase [Clostridia bacterium]
MNEGILYGVGVGPGDPELLTVKAARLIRSCDRIAIPHRDRDRCFAYAIATRAVPEAKDKPVLCVEMPMTRDRAVREAAYEAGAAALAAALSKGETVVFLTLGDPSVYATFAYLAARVSSGGFAVEWVPGVPSFCAAAAALKEPLCTDREQLHLIPGGANAQEALALPGTKVFMKGELAPLLSAIEAEGVRAAAVENCGTENERTYRSADEIPKDAGYYLVTIVKERNA